MGGHVWRVLAKIQESELKNNNLKPLFAGAAGACYFSVISIIFYNKKL
jgi:hypothetical protein